MSLPPSPLAGWAVHSSAWLIEEQDVDMLDHLNNIAAMALFERARWQMITERGHGVSAIRARQQAPVIIAVDVQFRKEVRLRQSVHIDSYTSGLSTRTSTVTQVLRVDQVPHIIANYTVGLFDLSARRLIAPTEAWRFAMGDPAILAQPSD